MPWERGDVLCPVPVFQPAFPRGRLILGRPESSSGSLASGFGAKVQLEPVLKSVRGGLPAKSGPTWEEKLTLNRRAARAKWESLVWKNKDSFEARNVLQDASKGRQADLSQALADCFAGKASATLHSRVGPCCGMFISCRRSMRTRFLWMKASFTCSWTRRRQVLLSGQQETASKTSVTCFSRTGSRRHLAWCVTGQIQRLRPSMCWLLLLLLCTRGQDTATLRRQQRCSWTS